MGGGQSNSQVVKGLIKGLTAVSATNIHIGAPNIHIDVPTIHIGVPTIHIGAPNIHLGVPNIHIGAPNIHLGALLPQVQNFMKAVLPKLDELKYVERCVTTRNMTRTLPRYNNNQA
eukprot:8015531-Pyramimonas_sp.AAC.1